MREFWKLIPFSVYRNAGTERIELTFHHSTHVSKKATQMSELCSLNFQLFQVSCQDLSMVAIISALSLPCTYWSLFGNTSLLNPYLCTSNLPLLLENKMIKVHPFQTWQSWIHNWIGFTWSFCYNLSWAYLYCCRHLSCNNQLSVCCGDCCKQASFIIHEVSSAWLMCHNVWDIVKTRVCNHLQAQPAAHLPWSPGSDSVMSYKNDTKCLKSEDELKTLWTVLHFNILLSKHWFCQYRL